MRYELGDHQHSLSHFRPLLMLQNTEIPEKPMFKPEFPPQEAEPSVVIVDEEGKPTDRVESALKCLPHYDPASCWSGDTLPSFRYWKIRDFAYAYRSKLVTPSKIAEQIITLVEGCKYHKAPTPLLISFDAEDIRKQATASTQMFKEGNPLSIFIVPLICLSFCLSDINLVKLEHSG
ncbi:hypothetical protein ERO13_D05G115500v2 [Gossypium hirsutum]|nr:hypothetical protein ERO13_D05G115500v2 [Gossypium hirsutum]KAG4145789.1 hypothetical protein ERO13_D05G115500v2 [Gossypium hirsutum]